MEDWLFVWQWYTSCFSGRVHEAWREQIDKNTTHTKKSDKKFTQVVVLSPALQLIRCMHHTSFHAHAKPKFKKGGRWVGGRVGHEEKRNGYRTRPFPLVIPNRHSECIKPDGSKANRWSETLCFYSAARQANLRNSTTPPHTNPRKRLQAEPATALQCQGTSPWCHVNPLSAKRGQLLKPHT